MKRIFLIISLLISIFLYVEAQNIPVPMSYVRLYDFIDELITDGVITHQTAVRPYTRMQVAHMLEQAQLADSTLNVRQKKDLAFYQKAHKRAYPQSGEIKLDLNGSNVLIYVKDKHIATIALKKYNYE